MRTVARWLRWRGVADRVLAAVLLVVALPALALASIIVFAYDRRRPVLSLRRVGEGGRTFAMPKVRTMGVGAVGSPLTSGDDLRVTVPGRVLRTLHIDELPQLASVVMGQMTLLGPRPEDPVFVDHDADGWREVLSIPPGMAGVTQLIFGDLEQALLREHNAEQRYRHDLLPLKLELDRWYVRHASPRVDALVLIGLVQRIVLRRRASLLERYLDRHGHSDLLATVRSAA